MSYYHIIYNSSEKPRNGGVGFGVRAATAGTPAALIEALEQNGVFNFDTSQPAIGMNDLKANPERILEVPRSHFYLTVKVSPEVTAHVLGRKVAVGFDYVYYKNYGTGRLGNYVVDCHVWTGEVPVEAFDLFDGQPAGAGPRFVPLSPVPSPDNAEMARLSLGAMDDLPAGEPVFKAAATPGVNAEVYNLFFALINARNNGRPLLVRERDDLQCVVARMMRMLAPEDRPAATFMTAYQEEGKKKGLAIIEINRHYPYELFERQFEVYDRTTRVDNVERRTFGADIERAMAAGDTGRAQRLTHWVLSDAYREVKDKSKATNDSLYNYVVEPERFDFAPLTTNAELREVLARLFKARPAARQLLDSHVDRLLAACGNVADALKAIDFVMHLQPHIDMDDIIARHRDRLTQVTLGSAQAFGQLVQATRARLDPLEPFIDLERLRRHPDYLQQFDSKVWRELYRRFVTPDRADLKGLLRFTLDYERLSSDDRTAVLNQVEPDGTAIVDACCALARDPAQKAVEPRVRGYIYDSLNALAPDYDCYGNLADMTGNPDYAGLFVEQLYRRALQPVSYADACDIVGRLCALPQPRVSQLLTQRRDDLLAQLLKQLKTLLAGKSIRDDDTAVAHTAVRPVLEAFEEQDKSLMGQWRALHDVLTGTVGQGQRHDLTIVEDMALDINRTAYVKQLLPLSLPLHAGEARKFITRLLDHRAATPDELIAAAKPLGRKQREAYWKAVLDNERKLNVQRAITRLSSLGEISINEAEYFMRRYYPEPYRLSKEPSIIACTINFFKGLLGKKTGRDS